jgi:FtsH-binding integral membrane protein
MDNKKIQSLTRTAGLACLFLVIIGQVFKNQNFVPQTYLPYLSILGLVFLSISLYLKVKSGRINQTNFPVKLILIFLVVLISGLLLIFYLTKQ